MYNITNIIYKALRNKTKGTVRKYAYIHSMNYKLKEAYEK